MKRLLVICSGVGHVTRGFESFSQQLVARYRNHERWHGTLGYGGVENHVLTSMRDQLLPLPVPARASRWCQMLAHILNRSPYFVEQSLCALRALGYLSEFDVILTSDGTIANVLWRIRSLFGLSFRIIFSNGAPFPPPYPKCDLVHHVSPTSLNEALSRGLPESDHRYIPYGFEVPAQLPSNGSRKMIRAELKLSQDTVLIASIAAIGVNHKRLPFLIAEVSQIPNSHLLLIGEKDTGFDEILSLLQHEIPGRFSLRVALEHSEAMHLLGGCDLLALTSLTEGFGRVVVEAAMLGVRPLIHDSPMNRALFDGIAHLLPFETPGTIARYVTATYTNAGLSEAESIAADTSHRFSWSSLQKQYDSMFDDVYHRTP